jgi:hypothetical protein
MIKKLGYRKLVKTTKRGYYIHMPIWIAKALLFDPSETLHLVFVWDDARPGEVVIRRATVTEANLQLGNDELTMQEYIDGEITEEMMEERNKAFLEHLVWSGEKPTFEPVEPGVLGLSINEATYYKRLPEEFSLQTFDEMNAPPGCGQRVIKKLLKYGLIEISREEMTGGRGRPRKWYRRRTK